MTPLPLKRSPDSFDPRVDYECSKCHHRALSSTTAFDTKVFCAAYDCPGRNEFRVQADPAVITLPMDIPCR